MSFRLGLLGGTFDPPHLGHLIVAGDVFQALELDRLLLLPAGIPPHKQDFATTVPDIRLEMVRAAATGDPRLEVSEIELERDGPSYTVDTLKAFRDMYPDAEIFFVIGADQFDLLATWHDPEEVARLARLVVMAREGVEPEKLNPGVAVEYKTVPVSRIDISSTEIRRRVRAGLPIWELVPDGVRRIIERESLYLQ